jgi:SOS-response transcriptional repressor LexA
MTGPRRDGDRVRLAILKAVAAHVERHGYAPTVREIGEAVRRRSTNNVHYHLRLLELQGRIRRTPGSPRAMQLVLTPGVVTVPVEWCEPCGVELPADHFCPARRAEFEHGTSNDLHTPWGDLHDLAHS